MPFRIDALDTINPMHSLRRSQPRRSRAILCGILVPVVFAYAWLSGTQANESLRLPQMGDPASAVLSPMQETLLGETLLTQIRGALPISLDPELNEYIQSLGTQLVAGGSASHLDFTFLLVRDSTINAFAAPGGIVAVNTGLLLAAQNESELAGVMAHEIAHVAQRHLARTYANAGSINLTTALAMLASIVAGAYGGGDVGSAALMSSMAASAQAQLAFSRASEQEADRVGIGLLAAAGFDPQGMPAFLQKLHQYTQLNAGPVPVYLSTHPVTLSRVSDTRNRAVQYSGSFAKDSTRFQFAKARTLALSTNPSTLISRYEELARAGKANNTTDPYAYALALTRAGAPARAIEVLQTIKQDENNAVAVDLALVQAHLSAGQPNRALKHLRQLNEIYPGQESIVYYLARALIDNNEAKRALNYVDAVTRSEDHNPALDRLKAEAAAKAGFPWLSHEALAAYYSAYGRFSAATEQLELALRADRIDDVAKARIRSKRDRLRELQYENPPGDQIP